MNSDALIFFMGGFEHVLLITMSELVDLQEQGKHG